MSETSAPCWRATYWYCWVKQMGSMRAALPAESRRQEQTEVGLSKNWKMERLPTSLRKQSWEMPKVLRRTLPSIAIPLWMHHYFLKRRARGVEIHRMRREAAVRRTRPMARRTRRESRSEAGQYCCLLPGHTGLMAGSILGFALNSLRKLACVEYRAGLMSSTGRNTANLPAFTKKEEKSMKGMSTAGSSIIAQSTCSRKVESSRPYPVLAQFTATFISRKVQKLAAGECSPQMQYTMAGVSTEQNTSKGSTERAFAQKQAEVQQVPLSRSFRNSFRSCVQMYSEPCTELNMLFTITKKSSPLRLRTPARSSVSSPYIIRISAATTRFCNNFVCSRFGCRSSSMAARRAISKNCHIQLRPSSSCLHSPASSSIGLRSSSKYCFIPSILLSNYPFSKPYLFTMLMMYSATFMLRGQANRCLLKKEEAYVGAPWQSSRPSASSSSESNRLNISTEGWWMVITTVLPSRASLRMMSTTCKAIVESSPVVGSSRIMMLGLVTSYTAIDVRFLQPPERPFQNAVPTLVCWQRPRASCSTRVQMILVLSSSLRCRRTLAANSSIYLGVISSGSTSSWVTKPRLLRQSLGLRLATLLRSSLPLTVTFEKQSLPAITLSKVVFPLPDGPMTAVSFALRKTQVTRSRMCRSVVTVRSSTASSALASDRNDLEGISSSDSQFMIKEKDCALQFYQEK